MKHTLRSRVLAVLLSLALLVGLMPGTVFAAGTDTGKAIQLGTSGIAGYDSAAGYDYIYFGRWTAQEEQEDTYTTSGPIKWRVLDDRTNTQNEGLFLLSDVLLGTGDYGGVYFDNSGSESNVWQKSTAQTWCKNFYSNNFSSKEQNAVLATTKSDSAYTSTTFGYAYGVSSLSGDKVFFLSAEEAENSAYGFTDDNARIANYGNSAGFWWLRSPYANRPNHAGLVSLNGHANHNKVTFNWAARPAFNLDLNSVLFISAAEGGKISAAASGGNQGGEAADAIFEIDDYSGNEWKLTLLDSSRNFSVTEETASGKPGDTITLNYTGATVYNADTAPNEYISVIIADDSGAQYYGRITQPTSASGQVKITIPASLADGTYTLNVFSEQYTGGENDDIKLTDYASAFEAVTLTVDTTAPTLSNVSAIRDSETTATVKFTSNEAGTYYYIAQDTEITLTKEQIAAQGTRQACLAGENEIKLNNLTASAWYVAVVAQDAAGNVSQPLKITIPAIYTLTVNLNGGSGNTTGGEYPAGEVINIDAGSRSNYRFNGWTSSNGGSFDDASSASTTFTMPAADTTITAAWSYVGGGSTTDYYRLTFDTNGGSEIASIRRAEHTTIDLSGYTPTREGYEFSGWYADKDLTEKITSIRLTGNATVYAGWEEIKENPFTDVAENDWFYDDVIFVFSNDLMLGTSDTTFNPYGTTTRAMVVTTLWRMDGEPQQEGDNPFTDVKNGEWYTDAIIWANENGITTGYGNNLFGTNNPVTREQLVAFFYRYAEYKGYDTTITGSLDRFADKDDVSPWSKDAMAWAVGCGIFGGRDHDKLAPQDNATRAEFAAMLHRFCERN